MVTTHSGQNRTAVFFTNMMELSDIFHIITMMMMMMDYSNNTLWSGPGSGGYAVMVELSDMCQIMMMMIMIITIITNQAKGV